jgi:hypothetical protein
MDLVKSPGSNIKYLGSNVKSLASNVALLDRMNFQLES